MNTIHLLMCSLRRRNAQWLSAINSLNALGSRRIVSSSSGSSTIQLHCFKTSLHAIHIPYTWTLLVYALCSVQFHLGILIRFVCFYFVLFRCIVTLYVCTYTSYIVWATCRNVTLLSDQAAFATTKTAEMLHTHSYTHTHSMHTT